MSVPLPVVRISSTQIHTNFFYGVYILKKHPGGVTSADVI
jgi:hypothetical protein